MSRRELDAEASRRGIDPSAYAEKRDIIAAIEQHDKGGDDVAENDTPRQSSSSSDDAGEAEVQKKMDEEQENGFVGQKVDPTPNENYSLEGGAPERGDNPTTPSEDDVKKDPTLGDQYVGGKTYTER